MQAKGPGPFEVVAARRVSFAHCIIAAGSESIRLPGLPDDPRIIDSTGALELDVPKRMLVVGGGIIGLEMATVYEALGAEISVVELTDSLMPGCDRDLVRPLEKRLAKRYARIMVKTKVTKIEALAEGLRVTFEGEYNTRPRVSPDGKQLAIVHRERGIDRIAVLDLDTRFLTVLSSGRLDESPSFAPNGAMIIYATRDGGQGVLSAVSSDGRVKQRIAAVAGDVREPLRSPGEPRRRRVLRRTEPGRLPGVGRGHFGLPVALRSDLRAVR